MVSDIINNDYELVAQTVSTQSYFTKTLLVLLGITAIGGILYFYSKRKPKFEEKLDDTSFQRLKVLSLPQILEWAQRNLTDSFVKGEIRILPPGKCSNFLGGSLRDTEKQSCIYFDVVDENNSIIIRKVVLPLSIADDLSPIKEGTLYKVPIEN